MGRLRTPLFVCLLKSTNMISEQIHRHTLSSCANQMVRLPPMLGALLRKCVWPNLSRLVERLYAACIGVGSAPCQWRSVQAARARGCWRERLERRATTAWLAFTVQRRLLAHASGGATALFRSRHCARAWRAWRRHLDGRRAKRAALAAAAQRWRCRCWGAGLAGLRWVHAPAHTTSSQDGKKEHHTACWQALSKVAYLSSCDCSQKERRRSLQKFAGAETSAHGLGIPRLCLVSPLVIRPTHCRKAQPAPNAVSSHAVTLGSLPTPSGAWTAIKR